MATNEQRVWYDCYFPIWNTYGILCHYKAASQYSFLNIQETVDTKQFPMFVLSSKLQALQMTTNSEPSCTLCSGN